MSEFERIAGNIASRLEEVSGEGGIRSDNIADIVGDCGYGSDINCYPGRPGHGCHDLAVFVSLTSQQHKGKHSGHLTCRKAIEKLVQHMQGSCAHGQTRCAVMVVDSWDSKAASEWAENLREIQSKAQLEVYLVTGGGISKIRV